jgi:hypothetical protein
VTPRRSIRATPHPTPEEGIPRVCQRSDEMRILSMAFAESLGVPRARANLLTARLRQVPVPGTTAPGEPQIPAL